MEDLEWKRRADAILTCLWAWQANVGTCEVFVVDATVLLKMTFLNVGGKYRWHLFAGPGTL